jgi:flagellar hook-associated protein 3 FlgL
MSGQISALSGYGFPALGEIIGDVGQIAQHMNTLTQQASSGFISNDYAGLGATAPAALSLTAQIDILQTSQSNIDAVNGPAQVTQTAMTQIGSIAAGLLADMSGLSGVDSNAIDSIAATAQGDLTQVANLLDSQYGGAYVFAGQDTSNPPVPDPDQITSSGFYMQISGSVASLSVNGAAVVTASTLALAGSNAVGTSPFSTYLSQSASGIGLSSVSTGDGQSQTIGLLASANTIAVSTGPSTTGSYMRDLMRALTTVASMKSSQASDPNFAALVSDTQSSLTNAVTAMDTDVGALGEQQSSLTSLQTTLSDTQTALTGQLSNAQEVDMASTLSNLSLVQTQLETSYQLIANTTGLSLAKFLPAGS